MSDPPASSPPPAEQATPESDDPGVDFTAIFSPEVLLRVIEVGAFNHRQLATLRLVNHALCDAASDPSLYRECVFWTAANLEALPPFVASSMRQLWFCGKTDIDLKGFSERMPNLTFLDSTEGITNVCASLRQLSVAQVPDADVLGRHTNLECLWAGNLRQFAPVVSLPLLARLTLPQFRGNTAGLLSALASATLEALHLDLWYQPQVSPGWWDFLSGLANLREFKLTAFAGAFGGEGNAFADALADHPTLAVLVLNISDATTSAVLRRGFPPNVSVLGITRSSAEFEDLLIALPPDLCALELQSDGTQSAADIHALLSRCPQLRALNVKCDNEAVEYLASGSVDRSLVWNRYSLPAGTDVDALRAAGHKIGALFVCVNWHVAGGLMFDGETIAV